MLELFGTQLHSPEVVDPMVRALKALQDVLGRHQDREVLVTPDLECLEAHPRPPGRELRPTLRACSAAPALLAQLVVVARGLEESIFLPIRTTRLYTLPILWLPASSRWRGRRRPVVVVSKPATRATSANGEQVPRCNAAVAAAVSNVTRRMLENLAQQHEVKTRGRAPAYATRAGRRRGRGLQSHELEANSLRKPGVERRKHAPSWRWTVLERRRDPRPGAGTPVSKISDGPLRIQGDATPSGARLPRHPRAGS